MFFIILQSIFTLFCLSPVSGASRTVENIAKNGAARDSVAIRPEWKAYFDSAGVEGSFLLYDASAGTYYAHNLERCRAAFLPASTFKIPNSLIGLETGVIEDADYIIRWDGVKREIESWNRDHSLRSAIAVSCVPYYQELARRVGGKQMKMYLDSLRYGNADISAGIDRFWLSGGSYRITSFEQIDFLRRLHDERLPVSARSMRIVKDIMLLDSAGAYILRGKTGWTEAQEVGWFIGWVETPKNVYFYACNLKMVGSSPNLAARRGVAERILRSLGAM
jgi:beta-lactamase class D